MYHIFYLYNLSRKQNPYATQNTPKQNNLHKNHTANQSNKEKNLISGYQFFLLFNATHYITVDRKTTQTRINIYRRLQNFLNFHFRQKFKGCSSCFPTARFIN